MVQRIAACRPDVIVVIAFGQKIGKEVVALPPKGAINVHASLLPEYRGAAPINWAIIRGETHTGVSIITLADRIDAGDILAQARTEIGTRETPGICRSGGWPPTAVETLAHSKPVPRRTRNRTMPATFAPKRRTVF
jgi:methionyl-tRNA formyltransferase